jgi:hypothetical protein
MANATATTATPVILTAAHSCDDVRTLLDKGRTTVDVVQTWLEENRLDVSDIAGAFGDVFDRATMKAIIGKQSEKALLEAEARGVAKGKASAPKGRGISWKVSKKGLCSVYGLNARFPVSLYLPQLRRFAESLFGLDAKAFDTSPVGLWAASNPTEVFPVSDYEADAEWLRDARQGKFAHVIVKGEGVAVSLSLAAPE